MRLKSILSSMLLCACLVGCAASEPPLPPFTILLVDMGSGVRLQFINSMQTLLQAAVKDAPDASRFQLYGFSFKTCRLDTIAVGAFSFDTCQLDTTGGTFLSKPEVLEAVNRFSFGPEVKASCLYNALYDVARQVKESGVNIILMTDGNNDDNQTGGNACTTTWNDALNQLRSVNAHVQTVRLNTGYGPTAEQPSIETIAQASGGIHLANVDPGLAPDLAWFAALYTPQAPPSPSFNPLPLVLGVIIAIFSLGVIALIRWRLNRYVKPPFSDDSIHIDPVVRPRTPPKPLPPSTIRVSLTPPPSLRLMTYPGRQLDRVFEITKPKFIIGRSGAETPVDLALDEDRYVSTLHAKIIQKGQTYYLIDCGSLNGTFINDEPCAPQVEMPLRSGMKIMLGKTTVLLFDDTHSRGTFQTDYVSVGSSEGNQS